MKYISLSNFTKVVGCNKEIDSNSKLELHSSCMVGKRISLIYLEDGMNFMGNTNYKIRCRKSDRSFFTWLLSFVNLVSICEHDENNVTVTLSHVTL